MKIQYIELKNLEIPFRISFKHATAERKTTETVIAIVNSENGCIGYGEGCPRQYVTNETIQSCMNFIENLRNKILKINSIESLKEFIIINKQTIDENPSAWCAIETAILDLLGKTDKKTIEGVTGNNEIYGSFNYTAVLGLSNPAVFTAQLAQYLQIGFNDYKIKICGDLSADSANIFAINTILPDAKIRLDANNLWDSADETLTYLSRLPTNFWAIEEPIKVRDYIGLKKIAENVNCKIILDESFIKIADFEYLASNDNIWIPNIRISKMGGLLRSLAVAEECKKRDMKFIIGAQVGETSILTRVAISLANTFRESLIAQEGAYGTHLLERDITNSPIIFGKNGVVKLNNIGGTGLGLELIL